MYNPDRCIPVTSGKVPSSDNHISEVQPIECQSRTVRRFMSYSAIVYNSNSCIAVTSSPSKQSGNSKYCKQRGYQDTHKAIILQKEREKDQLRLEIARSYFANQCMKWYWKCLEESSIGINKLGRPCIEWKSLLR